MTPRLWALWVTTDRVWGSSQGGLGGKITSCSVGSLWTLQKNGMQTNTRARTPGIVGISSRGAAGKLTTRPQPGARAIDCPEPLPGVPAARTLLRHPESLSY